ncbi:MAG: hypothetical protein ABI592_17010 [Acidobacteriota bacterium]
MRLRPGTLILATALSLGLGLACAHQSTPPPASADGADMSKSRQHAYDEAVDALHDQIHAPKADVAGVSQEDVTWNDSCLGCPRTGEKCTQVLTPGYRIILRVRDATYEYHSDRGGKVRLCSQASMPGTAPVTPAP